MVFTTDKTLFVLWEPLLYTLIPLSTSYLFASYTYKFMSLVVKSKDNKWIFKNKHQNNLSFMKIESMKDEKWIVNPHPDNLIPRKVNVPYIFLSYIFHHSAHIVLSLIFSIALIWPIMNCCVFNSKQISPRNFFFLSEFVQWVDWVEHADHFLQRGVCVT